MTFPAKKIESVPTYARLLTAFAIACATLVGPGAAVYAQTSDLPSGKAVDLPPMNNTDLWLSAFVGEVEDGVLIAKVMMPMDPVPLQDGDVIIQLNDSPISAVAELKKQFEFISEGERVAFQVKRDGEIQTRTYTQPDPTSLPTLVLRRID